MSFGFFVDSGLTVPVSEAARFEFLQLVGGGPLDRVIWFGSPDAGLKVQVGAAPGVDPLTVTVVDDDDEAGLEPSAVRLALSAGGLDAATPGEALPIGATRMGGVANALAIFIRGDAGAAAPLVAEDLRLRVPGAQESPA